MRRLVFDCSDFGVMERSGHSSLGIASLSVSSASVLLVFAWMALAAVDAPNGVVGVAVIFQIFVSLLGCVLGIPPLFSSSKKRVLAFIGVGIGAATFVISVSLIGIGLWAINSGMAS